VRGIWIARTDNDASDAGLDDGIGASAGAAASAARLQRDVDGGTCCGLAPERFERGDLGMILPGGAVPAFGHDLATFDNDGTNHRVRVRLPPSLLR
jgi:hypothetical protein